MLSYALAIAVALSSFVLFLTAFFMSDIHRQDDFLWSAVGLFYALVLWFCARNITGAVLLGQASASILLISFTWQTLKLRKAVANPEQATEIAGFSILQTANGLLKRKKSKTKPPVENKPQVKDSQNSSDVVTESEIAIPQTTSDEEKSKEKSPTVNTDEAQKKESKASPLGKIFGKKKKKAGITDTKLNQILDEPEVVELEVVAPPQPDVENTSPQPVDNNKEEIKSQTEPQTEPQTTVPSSAETPPEVQDHEQQEAEETVEKVATEVTTEVTAAKSEELDSSEEIEKTTTETENKSEIEQLLETNPPEEAVDSPNESTPEKITEKVEPPPVEAETKTDSTPTETEETESKETEIIDPKANTSSIDSLETVEVAEVLEALPEDSLNKTNRDRSDIIEVTATDIPEENESNQSNPDSSSDTNSN